LCIILLVCFIENACLSTSCFLSEVEGEFIEEAVSENNASLRKKKKN